MAPGSRSQRARAPQFARMLGDDVTMRQLYSTLLGTTEPGPSLTARPSRASRARQPRWRSQDSQDAFADAERLLRMAIAEQEQHRWSLTTRQRSGVSTPAWVLAILLGRTPETNRLVAEGDDHPLAVELLVQGDDGERARALQLAKKSSARHNPNIPLRPPVASPRGVCGWLIPQREIIMGRWCHQSSGGKTRSRGRQSESG